MFNVEDVFQSISTIFMTNFGERFFLPEFGSYFDRLLFQPIDPLTTAQIKATFLDLLARWEPRVVVRPNNLIIIPDPNNKRYDIKITFEIVGIPSEEFTYSGYLKMFGGL